MGFVAHIFGFAADFDPFAFVTSMLTSVLSWMSSILSFFVANPILLIPFGLAIVSAVIGIIRHLIRRR